MGADMEGLQLKRLNLSEEDTGRMLAHALFEICDWRQVEPPTEDEMRLLTRNALMFLVARWMEKRGRAS